MSRLASHLIKLAFLIAVLNSANVLAVESDNVHWYYQNGVVLLENSTHALAAGDSFFLTCRGKPQSASYLIFAVTRDAPLSSNTFSTNIEAYNLASTTGLTLSTNDIRTVYDSINGIQKDYNHFLALGGEFGAGVISNYFSLQFYVPRVKASDSGTYYCNTLELSGTAPSASVVTAYATPFNLRIANKLGKATSAATQARSRNLEFLVLATSAAKLLM